MNPLRPFEGIVSHLTDEELHYDFEHAKCYNMNRIGELAVYGIGLGGRQFFIPKSSLIGRPFAYTPRICPS